MRYAKRRDENEQEIIRALRAIGCDVEPTDEIDLIVGYRGRNFLMEVKHPKRATESRMRPIQRRLRDSWKGSYIIVTTADQAIKAVT